MVVPPGDFFPNEAHWPFREISAGVVLTLNLRSHVDAQGRAIEFTASSDQIFKAFYDWMIGRYRSGLHGGRDSGPHDIVSGSQ